MNKLIILVVLVSISACGGKKSSHHSPAAPPVEEAVDPLHTRPLELTQKNTIVFHRLEQMVSRFDCAGALVTRKLETQNTLSKKIIIDYENRKNAWSTTVYNRRTKDSKKGIVIGEGNFIIDYSPTVFNMRVKDGINDIEYVFNRCTEIGKNAKGETICVGKVELEKEGLIQLDVNYSSEVVPGEQMIHPGIESCPKGPAV